MSFLFSLLTGLGVGSGGLYVLWLVLVLGEEQAKAQGINLLFFSLCILSATAVNIIKGRIAFGVLPPLLFFGIISGCFGAMLAKAVETELLSRLFGGFLILAGGAGLFSKSK